MYNKILIVVLVIVSIVFLLTYIEPLTKCKKEGMEPIKPKVLIVGSFFYHLECIGFLCENLKNYNITVFIENDKFDYIKYYKNIYKIKHISDSKKLNYNKYKYIIKLTSNDPIIDTKNINVLKKFNNKIISIVHDKDSKDLVNNCIILCPYFTFNNSNSQYMFPLYNGITNPVLNKKYILYLGDYTQENNDNDLVLFNNNIKDKYELIVCGYGSNRFGFNSAEYLINNNIKYVQSISMPNLLDYLNQTKYILARKWPVYKDRMSGSLPVSISHNIPLIVNIDTANDYNITDISVTFNKNYNEVVPTIINDVEYNARILNLIKYKKRIIDDNNNKMKLIIKNIV